MKRLTIVTMLTLVPLASGCCNGWPRSTWYRGDACQSCATSTYQAAPVYGAPLLPAPADVQPTLSVPLPGPAEVPAN